MTEIALFGGSKNLIWFIWLEMLYFGMKEAEKNLER